MKKPLISIIVPIYNVKPYLERCFNSLIAQTYQKIEILLIDDGSTDGSGELCDFLKKKDLRVKLIHKKNGGVSSARNVGLDNAKGEYISFIDPDDYIDNSFVEELYSLIEKDNVFAAVCTVVNVTEKGRKQQKWKVHKNAVYDSTEYLKIRIPCTIWDKIFHKSIFDGLRFPEDAVCSEDTFLYYKLICKAKRIATTSKPLYFYLQRKNSITHSKQTKVYFDIFNSHYSGIKFLMSINADDETINTWYYQFWSTYVYCIRRIKRIDKHSSYFPQINQMWTEIKFLIKKRLNLFNKILMSYPRFMFFIKAVSKFLLFPFISIKRKYHRS